MSDILAVIDFIGLIGFGIALYYSWFNHYRTKFVSVVWLMITIAMAFGMLYSFTSALLQIGFYSRAMAELQPILLVAIAVSLLASSIISRAGFIKPL